MSIGDGKVGGDVAPDMAIDGYPRLKRRLDVLRYVGFDRFENWWGGIVCDRDLGALA